MAPSGSENGIVQMTATLLQPVLEMHISGFSYSCCMGDACSIWTEEKTKLPTGDNLMNFLDFGVEKDVCEETEV